MSLPALIFDIRRTLRHQAVRANLLRLRNVAPYLKNSSLHHRSRYPQDIFHVRVLDLRKWRTRNSNKAKQRRRPVIAKSLVHYRVFQLASMTNNVRVEKRVIL
jgi:hypothetical protein